VLHGEADEGDQAQEVEAARRLAAAEQLGEPREASSHGGRHGQARGDLQRGQPEDQREVDQLLERVVGVASRRDL